MTSAAALAGPSQQYFNMMEQIRLERIRAAARLVPVASLDPAWVAKAMAEYPMDTSVVSGEKLGEAGKSFDFAYVQVREPGRLVRFSSLADVELFEQHPVTYLRKIDAAAGSRITH